MIATTPSARLSDLTLDPRVFPVTDELHGLERLLADASGQSEHCTILATRTPAILDIRARALMHRIELDRFLALVSDDPAGLQAHVDTANALTFLAHAGDIAMLLVPARGADDRWAQAQFARERLRLARRDPTGREAGLIRRAVAAVPVEPGERRIGDPELLPGAVLAMARFTGAILPDPVDPALAVAGQPEACTIEHAPALEAFFAAPPDLADLVVQARGLLKRVDGWPVSSCGPASPLYDVRCGVLMLAYARLARVGLWPARTQADLQAKSTVETLVAIRRSDPGHLRALTLLALDVGYLIACQGGRFIAVSGIEL